MPHSAAPLWRLQFRGPVDRVAGRDAIGACLRGMTPDATGTQRLQSTTVLCCGTDLAQLPPQLTDPQVECRDLSGSLQLTIHTAVQQWVVSCRSVQVHREVAPAFYAAIPPTPVPLWYRAALWTLPLALKVPGVSRLLAKD